MTTATATNPRATNRGYRNSAPARSGPNGSRHTHTPDRRSPTGRDDNAARHPGGGTVEQVLRDTFRHADFRQHQESVVRALMAGRDTFTVMPTGAGKSLCYQLPAVCLPGTCIVISPLISLMKDQVDKLRRLGVRAAYLNSALDAEQQATVMQRLAQQAYDLLYVAPERFAVPAFRQALSTTPICLFAIDEAHCISEWGHDFRPDYLVLAELTKSYPNVPVAAFTATATTRAQEQIVARLGLRNPALVRASFDRPNLFYQVARKGDVGDQLLAFVQAQPDHSGIIYRGTRRAVDETTEYLQANGIQALPYHAGMDTESRRASQEAFERDECRIIVATIAFGMGIDKPNVRFVVHGDLPKSMDGYYQETGRAGRDGKPAHCLLLFSMADVPRARFFIERVNDEQERRNASGKLDAMVSYATGRQCRRRALLAYFGEGYRPGSCGTCDSCNPRRGFTCDPPHIAAHPPTRHAMTLMPTLKLLHEGLSYVRIAAQRGLKPTTIATHIVDLATRGERFQIDAHVPEDKRRFIEGLFARHGLARLKPVVEAAGGRIDYDEARLVRAALRLAGG